MTVNSVSGFPASFPYYLCLDRGTGSLEIVEVSAAVGTVLTIVRGVASTPSVAHSAGAVIEHVAASTFYNDTESHLVATTGAHAASAITFAPVGSIAATDTQAAIAEVATDYIAADATKQPLDSDLTAIAALAANGLVARTGTGTASVRTVTAANSMVAITNGDGVSGNPTVGVTPANFTGIPESAVTNLTTDLAAKQPLDATLTALAGLNATAGFVVETVADTFTKRTITAGATVSGAAANVVWTNGDGVLANPSVTVAGFKAAMRVYTAGATWTKPAGLVYAQVLCVGSGGGGGGSRDTAAALSPGAGGGGGSGAYGLLAAADLASSETIVVGAGGTAGTAGSGGNGGDGGNGGVTTFGSTKVTGLAGTGGSGAGSGTGVAYSNGAGTGAAVGTFTTSGECLTCAGTDGDRGLRLSAADGKSGSGGFSPFGVGLPGLGRFTTGAGQAGKGYGAGGGGGMSVGTVAGNVGGVGAGGLCVVIEYF